MEVKPGYKQTEVGMIPGDWAIAPLESVTPPQIKNGIVDGPFGSNLKTIHYRTSGIPIITSGYVTDGKFRADKYLYVDRAKFNEEKRSAVQPGDIVMAKIGERCGASAILPLSHETGILSGNALKITVDAKRHSELYVWQVLWELHCSGKLESLRTVGAQPALSMANLKKYKIPLPAKLEQEAIAKALSDADAHIDSLEQLIAKKRQIKQGAMPELLTAKIRLRGFSDKWTVKALREGVALLSGQHVLAQHCNTEGLGYPYITGPSDFPDGIIHHSKFTDRPTTICRADDILITVKGSGVGSMVIADGTYCISRQLMAVRVEKGWNAKFIYFYLLNDSKLIGVAATGLIPGISRNDLLDKQIPTPSQAEQTAIAELLSDMDAELAGLEAKLAKARQIKQGMTQELLTGRIRLV